VAAVALAALSVIGATVTGSQDVNAGGDTTTKAVPVSDTPAGAYNDRCGAVRERGGSELRLLPGTPFAGDRLSLDVQVRRRPMCTW